VKEVEAGKGGRGFRRFEDIIAWQKARELARVVFGLTAGKRFSSFASLRDQLQRAAVSVMANIAEGYERGSKTEFLQFLYIARGSCGEVRSHLYVALDAGCATESEVKTVQAAAEEVSRLIYHLGQAIKSGERPGVKNKMPPHKPFHEEVAELIARFAPSTTSTDSTSATRSEERDNQPDQAE